MQDCNIPLGMQSGKIPDDRVTATSRKSQTELSQNARLHDSSCWCASGKKKTEYVQIDLGKASDLLKVYDRLFFTLVKRSISIFTW